MAQFNTQTGQTVPSNRPAKIVEAALLDRQAKAKINTQQESDLKLLSESTNPEIQALCRLLNVAGN